VVVVEQQPQVVMEPQHLEMVEMVEQDLIYQAVIQELLTVECTLAVEEVVLNVVQILLEQVEQVVEEMVHLVQQTQQQELLTLAVEEVVDQI
jgi:hypothetical protein|tara:strand:+ start:401 stop:676 length:276 start_codon:yes stop_codon:yes gene_type:complete